MRNLSNARYQVLSSSSEAGQTTINTQPTARTLLPWYLHLFALFAYTLIWVLLVSTSQNCRGFWPKTDVSVYSPLNHLIEYERRDFSQDTNSSIYVGKPSHELDNVWFNLQRVNLIELTNEEAAQLDQPTGTHKGIPIVNVALFHQLHCLDSLRKGLSPEVYVFKDSTDEDSFREHTKEHCVDVIRQALMCAGDVTPITVEGTAQPYTPKFEQVHACRNFDKIYEGAMKRALPVIIP